MPVTPTPTQLAAALAAARVALTALSGFYSAEISDADLKPISDAAAKAALNTK